MYQFIKISLLSAFVASSAFASLGFKTVKSYSGVNRYRIYDFDRTEDADRRTVTLARMIDVIKPGEAAPIAKIKLESEFPGNLYSVGGDGQVILKFTVTTPDLSISPTVVFSIPHAKANCAEDINAPVTEVVKTSLDRAALEKAVAHSQYCVNFTSNQRIRLKNQFGEVLNEVLGLRGLIGDVDTLDILIPSLALLNHGNDLVGGAGQKLLLRDVVSADRVRPGNQGDVVVFLTLLSLSDSPYFTQVGLPLFLSTRDVAHEVFFKTNEPLYKGFTEFEKNL